ncbi:unnamed protein product [Protopolystoma xenopodis]|uniref:BTB domain-containing protein n=1 Tax=Protopolystoma xenopodis TaxID=117903 RepID=A0A3S5CVI2_9PLAT|nr:unnamed protein product [Protopolystoma xenopodis]
MYSENSNNIVSMPEDNVDDVRAMLEHIYTPGGRDMTSESAHRLLPLVHRYQIESLVGEAERMITFNMTDSMAPANLKLADLYGLKRLRQTAIDSCARLDAVRLKQLLDEAKMPTDLRVEILEYV